jgi:hypothetical protein
MSEPLVEVFLELPHGASARVLHCCAVLEQHGTLLALECMQDLDLRADMDIHVYRDLHGSFVVQMARLRAVSAPPAPRRLEVELVGEPSNAEERGSLRIAVERDGLRARVGDCEPTPVLDLSEVAFSVRGPDGWEVGDVLDAVFYDSVEELPGRVRVQSARRTDDGGHRYGLLCLDGLLKFALGGVLLAVQRAQIEQLREARRRAQRARSA